MEILKEEEYKKFFLKIEPVKISAPFGIHWGFEMDGGQIVTTKKYLPCFNRINAQIKTYENNHAKLAIGEFGAIFGSWNYSLIHDKSSKHKELVVFVEPVEEMYCSLNQYFDEEPWAIAHEVNP